MQSPKIHFACVFGVDYETDLMPYWSDYYAAMKFDSCHVFLHREKGNVPESVKKHFEDRGFSYTCIDGPHGNGMVRRCALERYALSLPRDDFFVVADADEFQSGPHSSGHPTILLGGFPVIVGTTSSSPLDYRSLAERYDLVSGLLIDRYTNRLEACHDDPFRQYQFEEPWSGNVENNFTPPFLRHTNWRPTRRTKILMARAGYAVSYVGSHNMYLVPASARIRTDCKVYHFAWRESAKRKLALKSYFSHDNLREIFNGEVAADSQRNYDRIHSAEGALA
jgi:hypothetical protein